MKKIFEFFICCSCFSSVALAGDFVVDSDFVVNPGQIFSDNLIVTNDVLIENYGTITGDIVIQNPVSVRFVNSGTVSGNISNVPGAFVDQVVHSGADLNKIGNLAGHDILVETNTSERLSFASLLQVAQDAHEINIKNTSFVLDSGVPNGATNIKVTGPTIFYVENMSNDISDFFASHVSGINYVRFENTDSLFATDIGNSHFVRQTTYRNALQNPVGNYLDALRNKNPNDKLIVALDSVDNINDFNDILARSVRVHPIKMMNFAKTFNLFDLSRDAYGAHERGMQVSPFYIGSDDFSIFGVNTNLILNVSDNFLTNFGLFGGNMHYDGVFDEFSGLVYGTDFGARYENNYLFARFQGVLTVASFDDVLVFDGNDSSDNPTGISGGMELDLGPVFLLCDSALKLKPFVGANFGYLSIIGNKETKLGANLGTELEYTKTIDGNKYGYGVKTFAQTDGAIYGGVFANMTSIVDGIGGTLNGAILHDDNGISYKVSLDINFIF